MNGTLPSGEVIVYDEDYFYMATVVAERLADLRDAERDLLAGGFKDVFELGKDGLGGFWPQIGDIVGALDRADVGLEHQVERARFGE